MAVAIRRARLAGPCARRAAACCCCCGCARSDWPAIAAVHAAAFDACHRPLLGPDAEPWFDPAGVCWVAEDGAAGEIVGFVYLAMDPDDDELPRTGGRPLVDDLFVCAAAAPEPLPLAAERRCSGRAPSHQGQGIGRRLLGAAEAHARRAGCTELVLGCLQADSAALAFYRATGWEADAVAGETGEGDGAWRAPDGHAYLTLRRALQPQPEQPAAPTAP